MRKTTIARPSAACLLLITVFFFAGAGCNHPDKKQDETGNILKNPPFAALTDSIRSFPEQAGLYLRRGDLLSRNDRHEMAEADYKKAWELSPEQETGLRYATTLSIIGKPDLATRLLLDCIRRFPDYPAFKRLLGEMYVQSGKREQAIRLYDTVLREDSANFEAWYEKGLLLEQAKDTPGAIHALQKAWTLQPVNTYALELAHIYAESSNRMALTLCDQVLKNDSASLLTDPFFIKGIYYSNTRQYPAAIIQFDSCIGRDWKFTDAYLEKGIVFFRQKNYDVALNTFRMAATVSNTYADAYFWIGRCYEESRKKTEAIQYYQRTLSLDKDFTEAREALKRLQ